MFISAENCLPNSEVIKTKTVSIYTACLYLPTSIYKHIASQDCIFYTSNNGDLWFTKFSSHNEKRDLKKVDLSPTVLMHGVADIVSLNNLEGKMFLKCTHFVWI